MRFETLLYRLVPGFEIADSHAIRDEHRYSLWILGSRSVHQGPGIDLDLESALQDMGCITDSEECISSENFRSGRDCSVRFFVEASRSPKIASGRL